MSAIRLCKWIILIAIIFTMPIWAEAPSRKPRSEKARDDLYGDPLPEGAIARLGSVRFRHPGAVHEVAFSPDGKLIAASSDGLNRVILWERASGRIVRAIAVGGTLPPYHLRFSADGKRLYGCTWYGRDMSLYAWSVESGKNAKDGPRLPGEMRTLGYSPDGREMLLLNRDAEIVRWDIDKSKKLGRYPKPVNGFLTLAALAGDRMLVPYFDGQEVGMWDTARQKQLWSVKTTRDKNYPSLPMVFSPDGKLFAVEAPPRVISLYESISGKLVRRLEGDVGKIYWSLGFSPDARTLAASCWDGSLRLWDVESGRERVKIPTMEGCITDVFFAPDSKAFATGGPNNAHSVLLWDTATGKRMDRFPGHASPVSWLSFSPDGRTAATSSHLRGDPLVRLWDVRTGRLLRAIPTATGSGGVSAVAFSPDGGMLASCGWAGDNKVRIWDVRAGRQRHEMAGHQGGCTSVAFAPDGKRLASGDAYFNRSGKYEGRLCIWDTESGKRLHEIRGTPGAIQQVVFSRDGQQIFAAAEGIHVYDADSGRRAGKPFQTRSCIWRLALSADGRLLASCDGQGPARLWELATRREIVNEIPYIKGYGIALTPDGRTLAISDSESKINLVHWPSGNTVGKLSGEGDIGNQVFFSPDGRRLATVNNSESTALIWDVDDLVNPPLPAVAKPSAAELRHWWAALRDDSATEAYKAVWHFVAAPEQALPFLAKSLPPLQPADAATIARLIAELDSDTFQVREKATRELSRLGETVVGALQKAKNSGPSLEQRKRLDRLLDELAGPVPGPEQLRAIRTVAVLEQIGGADARKILAGLAAGAAGARRTEEAKTALERLKRRPRRAAE